MSYTSRYHAWLALPAFVVLAGGSPISAFAAVEKLNSLKITEVVADVAVIDAASKKSKPALKEGTFNVPDVLTTGPKSRAELVAADGTVTRVGSNTVFSFSPDKREVNLEKGCVLFHSPTGKGGGTIRSAGASASVLGTSIIVTATRDGGFKLLVLEGKAKAALPNGRTLSITAGQLTFIMPGSKDFGPVIAFRLKEQVGGSNLVKGFKEPLASLAKIEAATGTQEQKIATGKVESTNLVIADTQVLETKVVDTSLIQTRADVIQMDPYEKAITSDAVVTNAPLESSRLFSSTGAQISAAQLKNSGQFFPSLVRSRPTDIFESFVGKNVTITAPAGAGLTDTGVNSYEFAYVAKEALTLDMGLGVSDPALVSPRTLMDSLVSGGTARKNLALIAGKSINISNHLTSGRRDYIFLGPIEGSLISVNFSNSTMLNGAGLISIYGNNVTLRNSSLLAAQGIEAYADTIDISNTGSPREIAAGYATAGYSAAASGSNLNLIASNLLSITNARLGGANIKLQGTTLDLTSVDFKNGSVIKLVSRDGQYSTTAGVTGSVNDVGSTLTYNGAPILTYNVLQADGNHYDLLNSSISIWSTAELALDGTTSKALTIDANPNFLSWLEGNRLFSKTGAQIATDSAVAAAMGSSFVSFFNTTAPTNNSTTLYDFYIGKNITATQKAYRMDVPYDSVSSNAKRFVFLAANNFTANFADTAFTGTGAVNVTAFGTGTGADRPISFIARNAITASNWLIDTDASATQRLGLYGVTATITLNNTAFVNYGGNISFGATSISLTDSAVIAKNNVTIAGDTVSLTSTLKRDYAAGWNTATNLFSAYNPLNTSLLDITGNTSLSITNANLGGKTINLTSPTLNLSNVEFKSGSTVTLTSTDGEINTSATSVAGKVNFLSNVTYGGSPITTSTTADEYTLIKPVAGVTVQTVADLALGTSPTFSAVYNSDSQVSYQIPKVRLFAYFPQSFPTEINSLLGSFESNETPFVPGKTKLDDTIANFGPSGLNQSITVIAGKNITWTYPYPDSQAGATHGTSTQYGLMAQNAFTLNAGKDGVTGLYYTDPIAYMEQQNVLSHTDDGSFAAFAGTSISLLNTLNSGMADDHEFYSKGSITLDKYVSYLFNKTTTPTYSADLRFTALGAFSSTNSSLVAGGDINVKAASVNISSTRAAGDVYAAGFVANYNATTLPTDLNTTGKQLSVYATNDLTVNNMRLGAGNITLDATTISLKDVDFKNGSVVNLKSGLGQLAPNANTNAAVVARKTNYISGVKYGGTALTNANESTVSGGKITHIANGR